MSDRPIVANQCTTGGGGGCVGARDLKGSLKTNFTYIPLHNAG